jgi:hypothetical protein
VKLVLSGSLLLLLAVARGIVVVLVLAVPATCSLSKYSLQIVVRA